MANTKITAEEKARKAEEKRIAYDNTHVYIVFNERNGAKLVERKDALSGSFTSNAIVLNTDMYNYTVLVRNIDGTIFVNSYTKTNPKSVKYGRNNTYAKDVRNHSKQFTIQATRGMMFDDLMAIVTKAKSFKECTNKTALTWIDSALQKVKTIAKKQEGKEEKNEAAA